MSKQCRDELKAAIIRTSMDLGRTAGESGLTMRGIAADLGISATALYQHFENKSAILREIRARGRAVSWAWIGPAFDESKRELDLRERLEDFGRRYVEFARHHPWLYQVLTETGELKTIQFDPKAPPVPGVFKAGESSVAPAVVSHVEQGVPSFASGLDASAHPEPSASPLDPVDATRRVLAQARKQGRLADDYEVAKTTVQLWASLHGLCALLINGNLQPTKGDGAVERFAERFIKRLVEHLVPPPVSPRVTG